MEFCMFLVLANNRYGSLCLNFHGGNSPQIAIFDTRLKNQ